MSGIPQAHRADEPFASGRLLIDRFRVVRRIAQGGMGVVYEAFDEKLHRRIALKCALPGQDGRLSPEVLLATEVSHPNICKIYEIHTARTPLGPLDFFTMEFLEGVTLKQRLQQGEIGSREAESIARDLCAGLGEAHRHGIIHGDMKPANVILTRKPDGAQCAVITDFGLARSSQSDGIRGGTAGYMAPELYAGEPITVASDIYALGVILEELVSGFRPDQLNAMAARTLTRPQPSRAGAQHMQRATELAPTDSVAFRRLGQLYERAERFPEALQSYSKAQSLAPGDARIYWDLANMYRQQSNLKEAIKALQQAVALAPDHQRYRNQLAAAYQDEGRFSEAEATLRTVLREERSADTLVALGQVLMYEKRDEKATGFLSEAAKLPNQNTFLWLLLGLANQRTGRSVEARTAFQEGLGAAEKHVVELPRDGYAHASLAYLCAQNAQRGRAAVEAAQALQLAPHHNDTLWMAALTYERIGDRQTALRALGSAPSSLLEDMRRWPEASALTSDPGFAQLLLAQGRVR